MPPPPPKHQSMYGVLGTDLQCVSRNVTFGTGLQCIPKSPALIGCIILPSPPHPSKDADWRHELVKKDNWDARGVVQYVYPVHTAVQSTVWGVFYVYPVHLNRVQYEGVICIPCTPVQSTVWGCYMYTLYTCTENTLYSTYLGVLTVVYLYRGLYGCCIMYILHLYRVQNGVLYTFTPLQSTVWGSCISNTPVQGTVCGCCIPCTPVQSTYRMTLGCQCWAQRSARDIFSSIKHTFPMRCGECYFIYEILRFLSCAT